MSPLLLALFVAATPAQPTPTAQPMLEEAGFQFTAAERATCSADLLQLQGQQRVNANPQWIATLRERFQQCVLRDRTVGAELRERWKAEAAERQAQQARTEEHQRKVEEERRLEDDLVEKLLADPKGVHALLSADLCWGTRARADVMGELAKDKKYSQIGGAVDTAKRVELQNRLAEVDDYLRVVRAKLKVTKKAPITCSDPGIKLAEPCLDPTSRIDQCGDDDPETARGVRAMVRAARVVAKPND